MRRKQRIGEMNDSNPEQAPEGRDNKNNRRMRTGDV